MLRSLLWLGLCLGVWFPSSVFGFEFKPIQRSADPQCHEKCYDDCHLEYTRKCTLKKIDRFGACAKPVPPRQLSYDDWMKQCKTFNDEYTRCHFYYHYLFTCEQKPDSVVCKGTGYEAAKTACPEYLALYKKCEDRAAPNRLKCEAYDKELKQCSDDPAGYCRGVCGKHCPKQEAKKEEKKEGDPDKTAKEQGSGAMQGSGGQGSGQSGAMQGSGGQGSGQSGAMQGSGGQGSGQSGAMQGSGGQGSGQSGAMQGSGGQGSVGQGSGQSGTMQGSGSSTSTGLPIPSTPGTPPTSGYPGLPPPPPAGPCRESYDRWLSQCKPFYAWRSSCASLSAWKSRCDGPLQRNKVCSSIMQMEAMCRTTLTWQAACAGFQRLRSQCSPFETIYKTCQGVRTARCDLLMQRMGVCRYAYFPKIGYCRSIPYNLPMCLNYARQKKHCIQSLPQECHVIPTTSGACQRPHALQSLCSQVPSQLRACDPARGL